MKVVKKAYNKHPNKTFDKSYHTFSKFDFNFE